MENINAKYKFCLPYFGCAIFLFATEVIIGMYAHDGVIRPYGGDFLIVIFIYCLVKSFLNAGVMITAISVLLFAYIVEFTQYFHLIKLLGWQHSTVARLILGTSFSWTDLLCYLLGIFLVLIVEKWRTKELLNTTTI